MRQKLEMAPYAGVREAETTARTTRQVRAIVGRVVARLERRGLSLEVRTPI